MTKTVPIATITLV